MDNSLNSLTQKRSHGPADGEHADGEHPVLFRPLQNPMKVGFSFLSYTNSFLQS